MGIEALVIAFLIGLVIGIIMGASSVRPPIIT